MKIVLPQDVITIIDRLESCGHEAYAVGGCVRDSILGKEPADWDITTSASPQEVKDLFSHTIDTGIAHGTVTIMCGKTGYEVTTYRLGTELRRITFTGTWTLESDEVLSRRAQLEAAAALWLEGLPDGTDDFEKVKYIYDELILRTEYEQGSADSQTICSVLLNQRSVCQGYAKTFQYLCQLAGIPAMLVTGDVNGEGHAWNIVFLDGDWYYIDPTWGDASYQREEGEETPALTETVNYDYFCVTTQEIERTHSMDDNQLLPVCNAVQDQYYRHEGLYLQSADKEKIDEIFARAAQKGAPMVCFQCADDTVYQEVYRLLIEERGIFAYLPESETTAAYLDSDRERTFYFWFTEVS